MKVSRVVFFALASAAMTGVASADFNTAATLSWTRPISIDAATASNTTYQEWDGFGSVGGPNAPTVIYNPNITITADAYDSTAATDGAFLAGSDIYSFSDIIHPRAIVGGNDIAGNVLNVAVEAQSFGPIDTSLLVNGAPASSLSGYSYSVLSSTDTDSGGFGIIPVIDQEWTFTVPDTTSLQMDWTWGDLSTGEGLSVALQDISVDTQSEPGSVPEPASLGLLAGGAALLIFKRGRRR